MREQGGGNASRFHRCRERPLALHGARRQIKPVPRAVVTGEGKILHAPHKGVFPLAVTVYVAGEFFRQRLFEPRVFFARVLMRTQIIAERQVPLQVERIVRAEDVDLVGALVAALAQITPAGNAEFAQIFIARSFKFFRRAVGAFEALHRRHYIYDGFCRQTGHGGAAYMIDGGEVFL